MKNILCFGDSNTYGLIPKTKNRYDYNTRWTGILNQKLSPHGYRILEEGLCGRTTVFSDHFRASRNGSEILPIILETHSPIDYVVLMLGTNDCKVKYNASPQIIGNGITKLIKQIRDFDSEIKILLVSPIVLEHGIGEEAFDQEFNETSVVTSRKLKEVYKDIALIEKCLFLAASDYAIPSIQDKEHLNKKGHTALAEAIFQTFLKDFAKSNYIDFSVFKN